MADSYNIKSHGMDGLATFTARQCRMRDGSPPVQSLAPDWSISEIWAVPPFRLPSTTINYTKEQSRNRLKSRQLNTNPIDN